MTSGASYTLERRRMVDEQLRPPSRDITHPRVLQAMLETPRHLFIPEPQRAEAYHDTALPIGHGQTISQPYIVALMTQALAPQPHHRVLEIGTGSGYQAAILAPLVAVIHTLETIPALAQRAANTLTAQGIQNVHVHPADGQAGWPTAAPYDAILITCATPSIPPALPPQLANSGRLILPLGPRDHQQLTLLEKLANRQTQTPLCPVRFVPLR